MVGDTGREASIDLTGIPSRGLADHARLCGWTIATAHARTGDRIAITSCIGSGDRFGEVIADCGRLGALRGVSPSTPPAEGHAGRIVPAGSASDVRGNAGQAA
jgi:hypothetical protein